MGIPVGPDASFLIGELLLSSIDTRMAQTTEPVSAARYYDDYELSFLQLADAERALALFQQTLADFNLLANPIKTRIVSLPTTIESPWTGLLSNISVGIGPRRKQRLIHFFDTVVEQRRLTSDAQVIGYAIARFDEPHFLQILDWESWLLIQSTLCHLVVNEPSAIVQLIRLLANIEIGDFGLYVDRDLLTETLNQIIVSNAPLGHGSEVCWALWGLIGFGLPVSAPSCRAVSTMPDSVVSLLALDARSRNLTIGALDDSLWRQLITNGGLYGEHWLLAYEAPMQGWLGSRNEIVADPNFSLFEQNNVRFYTKFKRLTKRVVRELDLWSSGYDSSDDSDDDPDEEEDDDEESEPPVTL